MLSFTGCANRISIKIVTLDSTTGQPIAGVSTRWLESHHDIVLGSHYYGPTNLPTTTENGIVQVENLNTNWGSTFTFTRSGYSSVYAFYGNEHLTVAKQVKVDTIGGFIFNGNFSVINSSNGFFVVKMDPHNP